MGKAEIKEGIKTLIPAAEQLERIIDKFTKAKELKDALPSPIRSGEIEGPKKQLPSPEDDLSEVGDGE